MAEARLDEDIQAVPTDAAEDNAVETGEGDSVESEAAETEDERAVAFAAAIRMAEALLFAAAEPLDEATLRKRMPKTARVPAVLAALEDQYRSRGVNLKKVAGRWEIGRAHV